MQKLKKALSCVGNIIFYPVLAVILAVLVLVLFGIKPYIVMSGSMEPVIHTGSVCFVDTKAQYAEITKGDVIAFRVATGGLVTHRVIEITEEGMETKGDANDVSDGVSTTVDNFHGKTLFSVPYAGYVIRYLQRPAVLGIAFILIVGSLALNLVDSGEEKKEKDAATENSAQNT